MHSTNGFNRGCLKYPVRAITHGVSKIHLLSVALAVDEFLGV